MMKRTNLPPIPQGKGVTKNVPIPHYQRVKCCHT